MSQYNVIHASVIGTRKKNEDTKLVDKRRNIYILTDGMGGEMHREGKVCSILASQLLYHELKQLYSRLRRGKTRVDRVPGLMERLVAYTNNMVTACASNVEDVQNCGTTLDACFIFDDTAYMAHVGEGAIFVANTQKMNIKKITHEHVSYPIDISSYSEIEQQIIAANLGLESYIGHNDNIQIDIHAKPMLDGDAVVMSTDGLTNSVTQEEILEVLVNNDMRNVRKRLLELAKRPVGMELEYEKMRGKGHSEFDLKKKCGDNTSFIIIYKGEFLGT